MQNFNIALKSGSIVFVLNPFDWHSSGYEAHYIVRIKCYIWCTKLCCCKKWGTQFNCAEDLFVWQSSDFEASVDGQHRPFSFLCSVSISSKLHGVIEASTKKFLLSFTSTKTMILVSALDSCIFMHDYSSHQLCQPLPRQHLVADLSIFYRYFHRNCSQQIMDRVPVTWRQRRTTRCSNHSKHFQLPLPNPGTPSSKSSCISRIFNLWNILSSSSYLESCKLPSFKFDINDLTFISLFS